MQNTSGRNGETEYAVKFRHTNGTIHRTVIHAAGPEALFDQVQGEGRCEILTWAALRPSDDRNDLASLLG